MPLWGESERTKQINKKLLRIKPPEEFRRTPRPIQTYSNWKASELRAWLLYYSLPVLSGILPADYIHHLSMLVSAIHLLLGDAICVPDIDKAHQLLEEFYKLTPQIYPQAVCTMNFHGLIHLSKFVRTWGPLWSYSCFGFESMNGYLRKHCHGTRNVLPQLIHNIRMQQMLPINGKTLIASASSSARTFIESLLETATKTQCITELKGRVTHKKVGERVDNALSLDQYIGSAVPLPTLPVCNRIRHNSTLYAIAAKDGDSRVRDGSICAFPYQSHLYTGSIEQFCFCDRQLIAVIRVFNQTDQSILDSIHPPTLPELSDTLSVSMISPFVF